MVFTWLCWREKSKISISIAKINCNYKTKKKAPIFKMKIGAFFVLLKKLNFEIAITIYLIIHRCQEFIVISSLFETIIY
jgi:hypothetical protein